MGEADVERLYRIGLLRRLGLPLADISDGRYSLGIGVGNSYDYDQLGVADERRTARFEECVEVLAGLLRDGEADLDGAYWQAHRAELALRPDDRRRPAIVVAAGGPRTMRVAVRYGDAWNGWAPVDPEGQHVTSLLDLLASTCRELGRDPSSVARTVDLAVDPLDVRGARDRSCAALARLDELGVDEVRCYPVCEPSPAARMEALEAYADLVPEI